MSKLDSNIRSATQQLEALCALSDAPLTITPDTVNSVIHDAPDPETALAQVMSPIDETSDTLKAKWRQVVFNIWSEHHTHIPHLLELPFTSDDVSDVVALKDSQAFLQSVANNPPAMTQEHKEWLLAPDDVFRLMSSLPSTKHQLMPVENEWQHLNLRRTRAVLESLRLIRRINGKLVVVKSRFARFQQLPAIQQYYLFWHAETYHINWADFSGIWGEYLKIVQEYLPLLWSLSEGTLADIPHHLRNWNQDVWDTYHPLWQQEGLLDRPRGHAALLSLVKVHSLPTAVTQVIVKDLFERYGIVYGEGEHFAYSELGIELIAAERTEDLPCALDVLS